MSQHTPEAFGEIAVAPHVRRFLDIAAAHLDDEAVTHLQQFGSGNTAETEHGWWVQVPVEPHSDTDYPQALRDAFAAARERGCRYILFDADAEPLDDLPVYDGSDQEEEPA
jgi:erythromycin esterase-like protein